MEISVRRIAAGEGAVLRDVRLRALHDSPTAFASRFAAESIENDRHWADRALNGSTGHATATFVAVRADGPVGLVVGYHPDPSRRAIELVSMRTAPSARRHGVARKLVDTLVRWADEAAAGVLLRGFDDPPGTDILRTSRGCAGNGPDPADSPAGCGR